MLNQPPQSSSQLCLSSLSELAQVKLLCALMGTQVTPALPWSILQPLASTEAVEFPPCNLKIEHLF